MSMKDLLNKMSQLEALPAPKTRQVLNESSPAPVATTTKRSLKDVFKELHEAIPAGAKPLPVMDPTNKQVGAGVLTSKDSTIQGMLSKLGPNDVQIVQAPGQTQPGQQQSNQQQSQQKSLQPMQASNQPNQTMQEEEFDEANTGDEAEEKFNKYNAKELDYMLDRAAFKSKPGDAHKQNRARQAKDAAYNIMIRKKYPYVAQPSDENLDEGAKVDRMVKHIEKSEKKLGKSKDEAENIAWATANKRGMLDNKNKKKVKEGDIAPTSGIDTRGAGLGAGRSATTLEGKKPDFLDLDKDGNRKEPMKKAAVDKKKKAVNEAAGDTSDIGYELLDMAEEIKELARNAMRLVSGTAEEGRASSYWYPHIIMAVSEDHSYLGKSMFTMVDSAQRLIDGGDDEDDDFYTTTSESKKTKKKKVDESMNHGIQAARLEGKSHGLKGHAYAGKHADMEEARAYHEGYKEGLDELHGMDIRQAPVVSFLKREARMPATTRGMAQRSLEDTPLDEMIDEAESSRGPYRVVPAKGNYMGNKYDVVDSSGRIVMTGQDETQARASADFKNNNRPSIRHEFSDFTKEGNAFTGALARTPKGGKFSVGGKSFIDRSSYDSKLGEGDFAFEAWDRQLNSLIKEGFSVSISKGESNSPDSVNVNATDAEADMLLSLVKQAGMGIFGGDEGSDYGSPEVGGRSEINSPGGIEVVDDHDGMLGLMKKLSGIEGPNADYEEEDCGCEECGNSPCGCDNEKMSEARCDECGMMESKCGGHDEVLDEVESEDQMEFKVAEANAPDSGAANATNDTQGNAAANQALAKADAGQDIEDGMQDQSVQEELEPWMDKDAAEDGKVPAFMRKDRWEKNMADEIGPPALRRVKDEEPKEKENDVKESFTNLYKKLAMLSEEAEQLDELSPELLKRAATASSPDKRKYQAPKDVKFMSGKTYYYRRSGGGKPISIKNPDHAATYLSIDDEVSSDPAQTNLIKVSDVPELAMVIKARDQQYNFNKSKQDKFNQGSERAMAKRLQAPPSYMSPAKQRQYTKTTADQAPGNKEKVDEWANQVGKGPGKGTDASLMQSIDFMMNDISGGLNKRKSTGQTTIPVVASQLNRLASRNTTSINENIESHIKSLRAGRMADDDRDHPEIDNHDLYDDLTSKVSQMEDEDGGARYLTLSGEANDIALRIASDTGFSAFSIIRYCSSRRAFNRWFNREKPAPFWRESVSEMKRLAGLNDEDDGDGIPGVDAVSIAAKAAAAKGIDAPSAEEIAQKASEIKQLFDFLDAKGQIAPEFSKTGNSKTGNPEALDESLRYEIDKAKRKFIELATWFGVFLLIAPLADAVLGISLPVGLFHPWNMITGEPIPGEVGYRGSAFPLRGPKYDDLNEIRRLSGLSEDDDGDGIPGVDLVSIAAKAAADKGIDAPSAEEIKANLDDFRKSYAILKANGQEPVDESLDKLKRDAEKMFWNAAKFLGVYQLVVSPVASYLGIPHPDLAYIVYDAMAMLTPPSRANFYDY